MVPGVWGGWASKLATWNSFLENRLPPGRGGAAVGGGHQAVIHLKYIQVCFPFMLQKMMPGRPPARALLLGGSDGRWWREGAETSH